MLLRDTAAVTGTVEQRATAVRDALQEFAEKGGVHWAGFLAKPGD
jgi:hypothetical protein